MFVEVIVIFQHGVLRYVEERIIFRKQDVVDAVQRNVDVVAETLVWMKGRTVPHRCVRLQHDDRRLRELRAHLQQCEQTRRRQFRFRKDPAAYLAALEAQLLT